MKAKNEQFDSITDAQKNILQVFLEKQKMPFENKIRGLSSYDLRQNKIPGRTWDINKSHLKKNRLIEIVKTEKTGKQIRKYYRITTLGIFILMKNCERSEFVKILKKYHAEIPDLKQNWSTISEIYGKIFNELSYRTLNRIKLTTVESAYEKKELVWETLQIDLILPTEDILVNISFGKRIGLKNHEAMMSDEGFIDVNDLGMKIFEYYVFLLFYELRNEKLMTSFRYELMREFDTLQNWTSTKLECKDVNTYGKKLEIIFKKGSKEIREKSCKNASFNQIYDEISKKMRSSISV